MRNKTKEFNIEDIRILASEIVSSAITYEEYDSIHDGYQCIYCNGDSKMNAEDFEHRCNCPVNVAKDVMTGIAKWDDNSDMFIFVEE